MDELIEKANKEGLISFVGEEKNQLYYKKLGECKLNCVKLQ